MAASASSPGVLALPAERFFRTSLFLLIATAVATLVSTGKLDLMTMILAPSAVMYKGVRWWRRLPVEVNPRTATRLVGAYLIVFPIDVLFFSRTFVAGSTNPALYAALLGAVHFLLFVMIIRLYSATTDRDALFLAMLAFAGVLASAVLTIDTAFLGLFFLFLLFGVATFVGLEIRRGARGSVGPPAAPRQESRFTRALILATLSVSCGAIVIGGALFFFFPRFSAGYWGRAGLQPRLISGFSDDVELGQIGEIKKNSSVVMRVRTGKPVSYPLLRWRGIALSTFDGKRWYTAERASKQLSPSASGAIYTVDRVPRPDPSWRENGLRYTVLLQPLATDAVFAPADVISLRGNFTGEGSNPEIGVHRSYLLRDSTGSLFNPFHNYVALRYEGFSVLPAIAPARLRGAASNYPQEIRDAYLQLPEQLDPRISELATQITANARTPYDKTVAVENYLRSQFTYTLNLTGKPGEDPLAHFLFETKAGHCEYFASSMAILLRTLGIPTLEVNGFLPGEYNDLAGDYIVRASDAHSWVEVYFPGSGWLTFDPTPPGADAEGGFLSRLGKYMDWFELTWNEWVINYDFIHQILLAQNVQRSTRNWTDVGRNWYGQVQERGRRWMKSWNGGLTVLLPLAFAAFLLILRFDWVASVVRRLWLSWQLRSPQAQTNPQLASRLYTELLRLLARRGLARRASQTAFEFAAAVDSPGLAPAVREFTQHYASARFGGAPCDALRLRALLDQIRSSLTSR